MLTAEDKLLNMALVFNEEFPSEFERATTMIQEGQTGMELLGFLRSVTHLEFSSAAALRSAMLKVTPKN